MQTIVPIEEIISVATANIVIAALAVSLVGALLAVSVRHYTSQNWTPQLQDVWYFALSAGISVTLVLLGYDTGTILTASSGINTPLALVKTGMDKYSEKKENTKITENKANIDAIKTQIGLLEAAKAKVS